MIREASFSDNPRPTLAYFNDRPERASRWPERWMMHRPDGTFAFYLANWKIHSAGNFQPSPIRIPELTVPQVVTAFASPQPENKGSRFPEGLHQ
jgi:hypothetical protein